MATFQRARTAEQRAERASAIVDTARAMLAEMPLSDLTLNGLAKRAGLAPSNVLRYFDSREAVLLELIDRETGEWLDDLLRHAPPPAGDPPADRCAAVAGADYYTDPDRGAVALWDNTFNPASWTDWLDYDAQAAAPLLTQPLLVVHSDAAASPESVREFVALVPGHVEQLWLTDVGQFDFYDGRDALAAAADAVAAHVDRATLTRRARPCCRDARAAAR
jgi:AcrR family transcriptional regulator